MGALGRTARADTRRNLTPNVPFERVGSVFESPVTRATYLDLDVAVTPNPVLFINAAAWNRKRLVAARIGCEDALRPVCQDCMYFK